jgi:NAD+ synthase
MRSLDIDKVKLDIQRWIKNYITSAKADGIVIGLSGGIDSSVTASLCVKALGKEKVLGISLPCESDPQDFEDAKLIADQLGIELIKIELTPLFNEFERSVIANLEQTEFKIIKIREDMWRNNILALANVKPRLRMTTLYYIGQSMGLYLVAGTGNRTEMAIGYFTKYGDGAVDFEPLGDLYKCEVRELAKHLNIPEKIIKKPPSAGLWKGQTDEDEIGISYDKLDEIIYRIDNNLDINDLNEKILSKVKNMMKLSAHKKKMPPIFKI